MSSPLNVAKTAQQNVRTAQQALQTAPVVAAQYTDQVNQMVAAGEAYADEAGPAIATVTAMGAAAAHAAPLVTKYSPPAILGAADAILLYGVINESEAALSGTCIP